MGLTSLLHTGQLGLDVVDLYIDASQLDSLSHVCPVRERSDVHRQTPNDRLQGRILDQAGVEGRTRSQVGELFLDGDERFPEPMVAEIRR
jgi:hypothetical protein